MARKKDTLDNLRKAAEVAAGALRDVAQSLEEMADGLVGKQTERRLLLQGNADRLKAAATLLTAEINASNPTTARKVMEVARAGLVTIALLLPGVTEGVSATVTERVLAGHATAAGAVEEVAREAEMLERALADEVDAGVEAIRQDIIKFASLINRPESEGILDGNGLGAPDLGVPNARQRFVYLSSALDQIWDVAGMNDLPEATWVERNRIAAELALLRQSIEVLAETDPSLYPPQVVRPEVSRGFGSKPFGSGPFGS